jgi:hypothetical protein
MKEFTLNDVIDIFSKYEYDNKTQSLIKYHNIIYKDILKLDNKEEIQITQSEFPYIYGFVIKINENFINDWITASKIEFISPLSNIIIRLYETGEIIFNYPQIIEFYKFINIHIDYIKNNFNKKLQNNIKFFYNGMYGILHSNRSILKINNIVIVINVFNNFMKNLYEKHSNNIIYMNIDFFFCLNINNELIDNLNEFNINYIIEENYTIKLIRLKKYISINKNGEYKFIGIYNSKKNKHNQELDKYLPEVIRKSREKKLAQV